LGTANITATSLANITSSPAPVMVHAPVDSIIVTAGTLSDFSSTTACQSIGETNTYTAIACSGTGPGSGGCLKGNNVTNDVGPFTWTAPGSLATKDSSTCGSSANPNTCVYTAAAPGQGQVTASVSGTVSAGVPFTSCPVQRISLHDSNGSTGPATINTSSTVQLTADLVDTKGNTLTNAALQFNVTQRLVATATAGGSGALNTATVTGRVAGLTAIAPSCTPPGCNANLPPVFGNPFDVTVSGTSTAATVYAASTAGTSLVPITTSSNTVGTAITLPANPNSMMFAPDGSRLYLGGGTAPLMVLDPSTNAQSTVTGVLGKVLAISPDGATVITATDTTVYIAFPLSTVTPNFISVPFASASGAAFSPDYQTSAAGSASTGRAYIVGGDKLLAFVAAKASQTATIGAVHDVAFLQQGSFAYTAGGTASADTVGIFAACNNQRAATLATSAVPQFIRALPRGDGFVAAVSPALDVITVTTDGAAWANGTNCSPANPTNSVDAVAVGNYTPRQVIVSPTGNQVFIVSDQGLFAVDLAASPRTASPITLANDASITPTTGGMTLDGALLYVGGSDMKLHTINVSSGSDTSQTTLTFTPDLVAARPQ
jgi:hypothetical protein